MRALILSFFVSTFSFASTEISIERLFQVFEFRKSSQFKNEFIMVSDYKHSGLYITPEIKNAHLALAVAMDKEQLEIFELTEIIVANNPELLSFFVLIKKEMIAYPQLFKSQKIAKRTTPNGMAMLVAAFSETTTVAEISEVVKRIDQQMVDDPCVSKGLLH